MPSPYDPAAWQDFYVMMGGANAALAGLVFVALSIHLKEVLAHPCSSRGRSSRSRC